jgi:hypothetical protein
MPKTLATDRWLGPGEGGAGAAGSRWDLEKVTARETVGRLRLELECRGISHREIERRVGYSFRQNLAEGKEEQMTHSELLKCLEVGGIEPRAFFWRLFGMGSPLSFDLLRPAEKATWPDSKRMILDELDKMAAAGSAGFEKFRGELLRIETLRENDPRRAESEAWKLLAQKRQPGEVVGLLAVIALGSARARAYELLTLASEILGPQTTSAAGGKLATSIGRFYTKAGFPRDAITVLTTQALSVMVLFGTKEEQARIHFHIAQAAAMVGLDSIQVAALRQAAVLGSETIEFAAKQLLAFQEVNTGDVRLASQMYDDLIASPFFLKAGRRARVYITCSRLHAHVLAGNLGPADEAEYKAAVEETRAILDEPDQVAATLDLVLYLESIGKTGPARQQLEAMLLAAVSLDAANAPIQQKYVDAWQRLGLPQDARWTTLLNRLEPRGFPLRRRAKFRVQD